MFAKATHGFDPSLRRLYIKSSLAYCISEPILKAWEIFGSPLSTSQTLRGILDLE